MALLTQEYENFALVLDPKHSDIWQMYKKHFAAIWSEDEVSLNDDLDHWNNILTEDERQCIKYVLAYFASSDGIVNANLIERFIQEITLYEAKCFYGFQIAMENVHARMYMILLETYVPNLDERRHLTNSIHTVKSIKMKADWTIKWINDREACLPQRIVAFAIVEGVFFSGSFCIIFWMKKRGLLPGLVQSNELISRDEGLHCDFAVLLYTKKLLSSERLSEKTVHDMMESAMVCEREFIRESIPKPMLGMNQDLMIEYVEYVADRLLVSLGYSKLYNAENPFDWMNLISIDGRTNFFERKVSEYQKYTKEKFNVLSLDELK